ncbi:hypothetical protein BCV69DRAFT_213114 [Microstroma glucosiphilum]|uniref:Secreted protein n=1 Tax=Pseudomicrostroma glucosiphilum TaxID=1684307 RepID=A0A316U3U7_9BASI|nr:hypothetical protein BCV69DRAFT_213114 [Pseudomicrostroma glucosiphilum]PWN19907.1 hypothetical protein BCV69DRAFT_213114 [Pseudomicrostroma glucosiphilum]
MPFALAWMMLVIPWSTAASLRNDDHTEGDWPVIGMSEVHGDAVHRQLFFLDRLGLLICLLALSRAPPSRRDDIFFHAHVSHGEALPIRHQMLLQLKRPSLCNSPPCPWPPSPWILVSDSAPHTQGVPPGVAP